METTSPQDEAPEELAPQDQAPGTPSQAAPEAAPPQAAGRQLASPGKRLVAIIIDAVILMIVSNVVGWILGAFLAFFINIAVGVAYAVYFWTSTGATPGKTVMKIKVVDENGDIIGGGPAIMRYVGYMVSGFAVMIGFIWIIIDKDNQGWHDKIAKTYVVDA